MLHEVAASDVAITDVVQPLRKMLRRSRVLIVEIESIDLAAKRVRILQRDLAQAFDLTYDQLVLALGTVPNFHRTPGIEEHALTMKSLGDAILLRNRMLEALDVADNHPDEAERRVMLTVVLAGGGFAGAETAGAVNDLLRAAIRFYPNLKEGMLRIVLAHRGEVILPELSESLGRYAQTQLQRRGVEVRLNTGVAGYDGKELTLQRWYEDQYPAGGLDSRHFPVAAGLRSAVRQASGSGAGEHLHADTGVARCMGAWRLRGRAGFPESG